MTATHIKALPMKWLLSFSVAVSSCVVATPGPTVKTVGYAPTLPDLPPIAVADVEVFPFQQGRLPEGIRLDSGPGRGDAFDLAPDFPTTAQPHRLLGVVELATAGFRNTAPVASPEYQEAFQRYHQVVGDEARRQAAQRGAAWAVFFARDKVALIAPSPAEPDRPSREALLAKGRAVARDLRRSLEVTLTASEQATWSLAQPAPIDVHLKRGECLLVVVVADPRTRFSDEARWRGLGLKMSADGDSVSKLAIDRWDTLNFGCAYKATSAQISIAARGPAPQPALGEGSLHLHYFRARKSEAVLRADERRHRETFEALDRDTCRTCEAQRCGATSTDGLCAPYVACLGHVSPAFCKQQR